MLGEGTGVTSGAGTAGGGPRYSSLERSGLGSRSALSAVRKGFENSEGMGTRYSGLPGIVNAGSWYGPAAAGLISGPVAKRSPPLVPKPWRLRKSCAGKDNPLIRFRFSKSTAVGGTEGV